MWRERIRGYLFPGHAEQNEAFRNELQSLATAGLRIVGAVQIGLSLFMLVARYLVSPGSAALSLRVQQATAIILMGLLNLALSSRLGLRQWARPVGLLSALLTAGILIWASMLISSVSTNPNDFIPGQITLVMLLAITTIPLRPMHTLSLGFAIGLVYMVAARIAEQDLGEGRGPDENYLLFVLMLTLLSTAVTAVVYRQRWETQMVLQQTVEAAEALRDAQTRIVMSESASSLSRLAAAVSHEMNTPVGALLSGVDTLMLLAERQATSPHEEQKRLVQLQADIRKSIRQSGQRLSELVARMQRFTNLDHADVQAACLNDILKDVAALIDPALRNISNVELDLAPLPVIVCRPQQLSVAFSNILSNACEAVNGKGRVRVSTRQNGAEIEVNIEDNGRGVERSELDGIFDPGFRVTGGRMAAGNWSLFTSRQIIREHGGDIRLASTAGQGTRVTVSLPVGHLERS